MKNKIKNLRNYKKLFSMGLIAGLLAVTLIVMAGAQQATSQAQYCCEKTTYGAWCQNADEAECQAGFRKTPTSCEATSYCKLGCCYDSSEGICMESTPEKVCSMQNGTWADSKQCEIPQCKLGCCVIGTQAAFVSLTRCKKLSSFYSLQVDFRQQIGTELECISLASLSDEGACVYGVDFIKTCKFTSRQECNSIRDGTKIGNDSGSITGNISFYKDYLCSNEELGTNCGLTKETTCIEGRDEVYFKDSCGNPANIYDAKKINDKSYWRKKVSKAESCGAESSNVNNAGCGNCNYFDGTICGEAKKTKPSYGNNICRDLNCKDTTDGSKKHGESWCSTDTYPDSVGSRYYRHLCMNGEEIVEPCADFRQEVCIEDKITTAKAVFSQAACRVNKWQDCYSQQEKKDCENLDRRDCKWVGGKERVKCVPLHAPGFKFWETGAETTTTGTTGFITSTAPSAAGGGSEAEGICSLANTQCVVEFVKKGFITGGEAECEKNCQCLTDSWALEQLAKGEALGDCGAKQNWAGEKGFDQGYQVQIKKAKEK